MHNPFLSGIWMCIFKYTVNVRMTDLDAVLFFFENRNVVVIRPHIFIFQCLDLTLVARLHPLSTLNSNFITTEHTINSVFIHTHISIYKWLRFHAIHVHINKKKYGMNTIFNSIE